MIRLLHVEFRNGRIHVNNAAASKKRRIESPLRKPVNTLAIVPTRSSKITVLARKAYNVLLFLAQEARDSSRRTDHAFSEK